MFERDNIEHIKTQLLKHEQSIAVAESVTAGLLQAALASADNAIHFFEGGLTAYNIGQKAKLLKTVNAVHAIRCNCVSEKMAADMALSICDLYSSDWGIGITGYATPVPESGHKVFAYYAITCRGDVKAKGKAEGDKDKDAWHNQVAYVNEILSALEKCLTGLI